MNFAGLLQRWEFWLFLSLCVFTAIQIFYFLFFFLRLSLYKKKRSEISRSQPVSVIVCARDEAANLAQNLPGLLIQQYPFTHEILVVNDNSFDDSKYVLEELQKEFRHLQILELKQEAKMIPGKKFPLSMGIKTAKHEILLLTDADCVPATEHWISSMQDAYKDDTEIVLGYSPYFKKRGLLNKLIRFETFHTALQYLSYALAGIPYMGVGRNLSYKKAVFFRHKGFSAHNHLLSGDDDLFINSAATKSNTAINIDPESFTLSKPVGSLKQWMRQKARHYSTARYYRPLHKFLLGLYAFSLGIFLPLAIATAIFYDWKIAAAIYTGKVLLQSLIIIPALKKLKENDLWFFVVLFDWWLFVYYILNLPALFNKPKPTWH